MIQKRFKSSEDKLSKMNQLAQKSSGGDLSTFSGVFKIGPLTDFEKTSLESILETYKREDSIASKDLEELTLITSEIKAINNQAVLLHGERIKKAQEILKNYKDGAFSSWLMETYGNRQTPYNFLLYYDFYAQMAENLKKQIEQMPRQAIYTLASRKGPLDKKKKLIKKFQGQTKNELLEMIREEFPLNEEDQRKGKLPYQAIKALSSIIRKINKDEFDPTLQESVEINKLLDQIRLLTLKSSRKGP